MKLPRGLKEQVNLGPEDETSFTIIRNSRVAAIKWLLLWIIPTSAVLWFLSFTSGNYPSSLTLAASIEFIIFLFLIYPHYLDSRILTTDKRLIKAFAVWRYKYRNTLYFDIPFQDIKGVNIYQDFSGRLLGYYSIRVTSSKKIDNIGWAGLRYALDKEGQNYLKFGILTGSDAEKIKSKLSH